MDGFASDIASRVTFGCTATADDGGMGSGFRLQRGELELELNFLTKARIGSEWANSD
jgi:hypothetical protein